MVGSLKELEQQFLEHLEVEKNRSLKTVENYDRYLRRFLKLTGAAKPGDITDDLVRNFRMQLNRIADANGRTLKKQTQFYHLIALRSFLKYLTTSFLTIKLVSCEYETNHTHTARV